MAEKASKDECVRVIVRCRPFNSKEKKEGNGRAVFVNSKDHTVEVKDCSNPKLQPKRWTFDNTFDENCTQRDIYDSAAAAIVEDVLEGFNGTIFAYGQTGNTFISLVVLICTHYTIFTVTTLCLAGQERVRVSLWKVSKNGAKIIRLNSAVSFQMQWNTFSNVLRRIPVTRHSF